MSSIAWLEAINITKLLYSTHSFATPIAYLSPRMYTSLAIFSLIISQIIPQSLKNYFYTNFNEAINMWQNSKTKSLQKQKGRRVSNFYGLAKCTA